MQPSESARESFAPLASIPNNSNTLDELASLQHLGVAAVSSEIVKNSVLERLTEVLTLFCLFLKHLFRLLTLNCGFQKRNSILRLLCRLRGALSHQQLVGGEM